MFPRIQRLDMSFREMERSEQEFVSWNEAVGRISAEAVVPYPPGIPVIMRGERVTDAHIQNVQALLEAGARFQNTSIDRGIHVFKGESL